MSLIINYSPDAREDLLGIKEYISEVLLNPQAASRIITEIAKRIDSLADSPELGPRISSRFGIETDFRYLVVENYLVFYRITQNSINILHILNGRQNYLEKLFPKTNLCPETL